MNMRKQMINGLAVIAMLAGGSAWAGVAVLKSGNDVMQMEYVGDNLLRMGVGRDGYMIFRDDKIYMVSGEPGQETVMDAGAAFQMMGGMMPETQPHASGVNSMKNTGRKETVAGITGDVWTVSYVDDQGKTQQTDMVLSGDKRARELRNAMHGMTRAFLKLAGKDPGQADVMVNELKQRGKGILRFGNDMTVTSLSGERVASSRFELPAEPMSMPNMQGFGSGNSAASEKSGGGFSLGGLFGKKAERQAERVENKTESEVDSQTDKAVDKALEKAFGKLFGN